MNALRMISVSPEPNQKNQIRRWIEELTDFTPQQVDAVLQKMENQQAKAS